MDKETLHFKIGLSGSTAKKQPAFSISVNSNTMIDTVLTTAVNEIEYFEFDVEVQEGECSLVIEFKNKQDQDTVVDANGEIVDDLLLNINSIEIDEIDLGSLLWTTSSYRPIYPAIYKKNMEQQGNTLPESITSCVNLGWNGHWTLPFTSPYYIWLLENI